MAMGWRACSASQRGELEERTKAVLHFESGGNLYNIEMEASEAHQALVGLGFVLRSVPTVSRLQSITVESKISLHRA